MLLKIILNSENPKENLFVGVRRRLQEIKY